MCPIQLPMLLLDLCSYNLMNVCALRSYRGVATGCRSAAFDFIETKSECEQAVAQFGLWAVREAIQPAWAYGCVFNKKTGLPWFNHAGRKKIQPKANEYAICRNHGTRVQSNFVNSKLDIFTLFNRIDTRNGVVTKIVTTQLAPRRTMGFTTSNWVASSARSGHSARSSTWRAPARANGFRIRANGRVAS